jgi:hypothetical protein
LIETDVFSFSPMLVTSTTVSAHAAIAAAHATAQIPVFLIFVLSKLSGFQPSTFQPSQVV